MAEHNLYRKLEKALKRVVTEQPADPEAEMVKLLGGAPQDKVERLEAKVERLEAELANYKRLFDQVAAGRGDDADGATITAELHDQPTGTYLEHDGDDAHGASSSVVGKFSRDAHANVMVAAARREALKIVGAAVSGAATPRVHVDLVPPTDVVAIDVTGEAPPYVPGKVPQSAASRSAHILDALLGRAAQPWAPRICPTYGSPLPRLPHDKRLSSGERGIGLPLLREIREFYRSRDALSKFMSDVCRQVGFEASICQLTTPTGLSLSESIVLLGEESQFSTTDIVGRADAFFSYSWAGTTLGDVLDAVERAMHRLTANGRPPFVWVDIFCASQNLLTGKYRDETVSKESDYLSYLARKEDTDRIFDGALEHITTMIFFLAPLTGEWLAPNDPYLADHLGEPPTNWMRSGPAAITRAWCLFEVCTALSQNKKLLVELAPQDRMKLRSILENDADALDQTLADIDASQAQISKVEDRDYILPRVRAVGGFEVVNLVVKQELRQWLTQAGRTLLAEASCHTDSAGTVADTMALQQGLANLVCSQNLLEEAEKLYCSALVGSHGTLLSPASGSQNVGDMLCMLNIIGNLAVLFDKKEQACDDAQARATACDNARCLFKIAVDAKEALYDYVRQLRY